MICDSVRKGLIGTVRDKQHARALISHKYTNCQRENHQYAIEASSLFAPGGWAKDFAETNNPSTASSMGSNPGQNCIFE